MHSPCWQAISNTEKKSRVLFAYFAGSLPTFIKDDILLREALLFGNRLESWVRHPKEIYKHNGCKSSTKK